MSLQVPTFEIWLKLLTSEQSWPGPWLRQDLDLTWPGIDLDLELDNYRLKMYNSILDWGVYWGKDESHIFSKKNMKIWCLGCYYYCPKRHYGWWKTSLFEWFKKPWILIENRLKTSCLWTLIKFIFYRSKIGTNTTFGCVKK